MFKNLFIVLLSVCLLAGMVPARAANAEAPLNDWPLSTGSAGNTHFAPINVSSKLTEKYRPVAKGGAVLAVYNNRLYTKDRSTNDTLYAIDLADNTVKWQFKPDGDPKPINDLSVKDGLLYLAMGSKLYALEDTGNAPAIKWSNDSGKLLTYGDSALFSLGMDNKVKAIDLKDGSTKWEYGLNQFQSIFGKMASGGGKLYFTVKNRSDMTYKMYALDAVTGQVLWTTDLYGDSLEGVPVYQDGKLYLDLNNSTYQNPKVYVEAFDANTGDLLWKYNLNGYFVLGANGPLSVSNDSVYTVKAKAT
jgi:outer membrane protein assembly factor BamB